MQATKLYQVRIIWVSPKLIQVSLGFEDDCHTKKLFRRKADLRKEIADLFDVLLGQKKMLPPNGFFAGKRPSERRQPESKFVSSKNGYKK